MYQVIARRWRPKTFSEVIGQNHVIKVLKSSLERNKVAHAYLFSGPRGVGKTSIARIFAKALNCEKGITPDPCGKCTACEEIGKGIFVDVIEMDAASNRGIDEIRILRENIKYKPTKGRYKVYIVDEVHMLTDQAFNALLKTLEEPPKEVVFIFATTERRKIPQTILSRCINFEFKPLSRNDVVGILENICKKEGFKYEKSALETIAKVSEGSLRDAEMLIEQIAMFSEGNITLKALREVLGLVEIEIIESMVNNILERNVENTLELLDDVIRNKGYGILEISSAIAEYTKDKLRQCALKKDITSAVKFYTINKTFLDLLEKMRRHPFPEMLFEAEAIRLCTLPPLEDISSLLEGKVKTGSANGKVNNAKDTSSGILDDFLKYIENKDPVLASCLNKAQVTENNGTIYITPQAKNGISWEKIVNHKQFLEETAQKFSRKLVISEALSDKARYNAKVNEILSIFPKAVIVSIKQI